MYGKLILDSWNLGTKLHLGPVVICKFEVYNAFLSPPATHALLSGNFTDFLDLIRYKGTYCSQEVAIKVLKPECVNSDMQKDFAQEVFIMRYVK